MGGHADSSSGSDPMLPVRPGAVDPHVSGWEANRTVGQWRY